MTLIATLAVAWLWSEKPTYVEDQVDPVGRKQTDGTHGRRRQDRAIGGDGSVERIECGNQRLGGVGRPERYVSQRIPRKDRRVRRVRLRLRGQRALSRGNRDLFGRVADFHHDVDVEAVGDVDFHIGADGFFESRSGDFNGVSARGK